MKLHNYIFKAVAAVALPLGLAGGILTSCSEWDDHYSDSDVAGSNTTLWEEIQSRPELSDFAKVLQNTMVFRQHKKTAASYAEVLNGGQSFTVMAPVNGTFNCDSLLQLVKTNQGDSAVEHFFIQNHITRTPHSAIDSKFRMLNGKRVTMTNNDVWGIPFKAKDIRSKNGILHTVTSELPYNKTIYEALTLQPEFSLVGKAIQRYNEDVFNENASVQIGLVEGVPVYADSVIYENNKLINVIGQLNAEDSTFYVAIPTNDGWKKAWDKAAEYFQFSSNIEKNDSLQEYWATRSLLEDAIFSRTIQSSMQDSLITYHYNRTHPEYHVFYKPFTENGLFTRHQDTDACSNGTIYKYSEWPFTSTETFFKKIEVEGEYTWYSFNDEKISTKNVMLLSGDSISRGAFLDIASTGSNNWSLTYKLENTLSGKYDICVVILPKTVLDPENTKTKPCQFKATINYIDEEGKAVSTVLGTFKTSKDKVDTIVVAQDFKFPACNYDQNNDKVSLTIQSDVTQKQASTLDRRMYLDCIYLKPKE